MSIFSKPGDKEIFDKSWLNPRLSLRYKAWGALGLMAVLPFIFLLSWSEREHFRARAARGDKYCNK